jgi:hypothetical protein
MLQPLKLCFMIEADCIKHRVKDLLSIKKLHRIIDAALIIGNVDSLISS